MHQPDEERIDYVDVSLQIDNLTDAITELMLQQQVLMSRQDQIVETLNDILFQVLGDPDDLDTPSHS